jgi:aminomethyltransferase
MGEIWITGSDALAALEHLTCNKVAALYDGKAQYSALLNQQGGVVDDIIIYRFNSERYLLCVNASNADKDFEWIKANNPTSATVTNESAEWGQIAVQGPRAIELVAPLVREHDISSLKSFHFVESAILGSSVIVARTGYTGEDGVELFVRTDNVANVWRLLLEHGASYGVLACGLGARDSLRLEAALPLHGHELAEDITALESGLGWIVKLDKGDFIGRDALMQQQQSRVPRKLVGFVLDEAGIARQGDIVKSAMGDVEVGVVTSGTKTPTVNKALGMALVAGSSGALDAELKVLVRGRSIAAHVVPLPFYKRSKK